MQDVSKRGFVRLIGAALGFMRSYRISAKVTFRSPAARGVGDWQPLNLKTARYLIFRAAVNGVGIPAVIDTGASRSVLSRDFATRIGLKTSGSINATTFTKAVTGTLYSVSELKVGTTIIRDAEVASFDLSAVEGSLVEQIPLIVGQDILGKSAIEIQFPSDRGRLIDRGGPETSRFERIAVEVSASRLPLIPLVMQELPNTLAIMDLGSNVPCSVSEAFVQQYGIVSGRRVSTTLTAGIEGENVNQIFCMPKISLGSFTMHDVPVCIVRDWKFSTPVNVGWPFFAAFNLVLDVRDRVLLLDADPGILATSFAKDRSGIGAVRMPDRIVVRHVAVDSPAQQAGLRCGDEILSLDGRRIDSDYPAAGERQGFKAAGTVLSMGLSDGREISLVLADYF